MSKEISKEKRLDWETKIREQRESGLSINQWCLQNQVSKGSFYYWRNRLGLKPEIDRSSFIEIPTPQGAGISIEYQGIYILIEKSFDPVTLRSCIAALRGISC